MKIVKRRFRKLKKIVDKLKKSLHNKKVIAVSVFIAAFPILFFLSLSYKRYYDSKNLSPMLNNDVDRLIAEISEIMQIPEDEKPQIGTVVNVKELKEKKFFAEAKEGDKVLIFTKAKKVILYRPSIKKIINAGMLDLENTKFDGKRFGVVKTIEKKEQFKVMFLNGTNIVGLASQVSKKIDDKFDSFEISDIGNAGKRNYDKTVVVFFNKEAREEAVRLADELSALVQDTFPENISIREDIDIAVILGKEAANYLNDEASTEKDD